MYNVDAVAFGSFLITVVIVTPAAIAIAITILERNTPND